jgi:hypothetical protein
MHTAIQFHSGIRWFSCGIVFKIMIEVRMKHFNLEDYDHHHRNLKLKSGFAHLHIIHLCFQSSVTYD